MLAAAKFAEKNRETKRSEDRLARIAATEATTLFRKGQISREEATLEIAKIEAERKLGIDTQQKEINLLKLADQKKAREDITAGEILAGEAGADGGRRREGPVGNHVHGQCWDAQLSRAQAWDVACT